MNIVMNKYINIVLVAIMALFCNFSMQAQMETRGTDFWLAFAKNSNHDSPLNVVLQIKVVAEKAAKVTITYSEDPDYSDTFTVPAHGVYTYTPSFERRELMYNANYTVPVSKKSVHIQSNEPVSVYAFNEVKPATSEALADATNVLPTAVLGTEYYHLGRVSDNFTSGKYDQNLIIATQNGTNIYRNGNEIATNLLAGQVYYHQYSNEISGDKFTSNKPVAYFSAHAYCQITGGGDNFFQQLTPVNTWGKSFIVPVTNREIELVRIVASQNNTTITHTGGTLITNYGGHNSLTLNAGQWVELEIKLSENGCYIQSDKPVQVCTYMVGAKYPNAANTVGGDEAICWVPPIEQKVNSALISPFAVDNLLHHYALIVTPTKKKESTLVSIGVSPAEKLSGGTWYDNPASGMSFYNVELTNPTASYLYTNEAGLIVYSYGFGNSISYYYMAGSAVRPLEVAFYVNENYYLDLPNYIFYNHETNFRADINGDRSNIPGYLRWYIDNKEDVNAKDKITWSKNLPDGVYEIKMDVLSADNVTVKSVKSTLIIRTPDNSCFENGTLLYKQDFGGNDPNSDHTSPSGLASVHSDLVYSTSSTHPDGKGYYNFTKNPHAIYPDGFHNRDDHTHEGDQTRGYMMFVDPYTSDLNKILYETEITGLCEGTRLYFSAWFTDINTHVHQTAQSPKIELQMLDNKTEQLLVSSGTITIPYGNVWTRFGIPFTLGNNNDGIIFRIYNKEASKDGNDLGIDDVAIRLCAPPVNSSLPDLTTKCEGESFTLSGDYSDDGTFGTDLAYYWERSSLGNKLTLSEWTKIDGSEGSTNNGEVQSSYTINSLTTDHTGYYRLVVTSPALIGSLYCRAVSDVKELKVNPLTAVGVINGVSNLCVKDIFMLTNSTPNGKWLSSHPEIATIDASSGKLTGKSAGTAEITYTVSNGSCSSTASLMITIEKCIDCMEGGTLLYKQDFGGNDENDPWAHPTGLPPGSSDLPYQTTPKPYGGYYALVKNPYRLWPDEFHSVGDHTHLNDTTRGYMMFVDPSAADSNRMLYQTEINGLCDGMRLSFSAWFIDINDHLHPNVVSPKIEMQMIDNDNQANILATTGTVTIPTGKFWTQIGFNFTLPTGVTDVIFKILNRENSTIGNDWAIDDIEIRFCAPSVNTNLNGLTKKCVGDPLTLTGSYVDDGTFGPNLLYRWIHSVTGNILNPEDWDIVGGTEGSTNDGKVISSFSIDSLISSDAGFYRLVVTPPSLNDSWYCSAASDVIEIKVKSYPVVGIINGVDHLCLDDFSTMTNSTPNGKWSSNHPEIAAIDASSGKVTGVGVGVAEIRYTVSNGVCESVATFMIIIDKCPDCMEGGTLLYRQDFGGNDVNDPWAHPTGLPPGSSDLPYQTTPKPNGGYYALVKNPYRLWKAEFHSVGDHTHPDDTTRGYMMFVDPSAADGNRMLYQTEINGLCDGMRLSFSAWFIDINDHLHPNVVSPKIEMQMIDKNNQSNILATTGMVIIPTGKFWTQIGFYFTLPTGVNDVIFKILNRENSTIGNDWAIDDIEIRFCAPSVNTNLPDFEEKCEGDSLELKGGYYDDGTFGKNLLYRWIRSATGDILNPEDWETVDGTEGTTNNGKVISTFAIDSLTVSNAGYYRLVVAPPSLNDSWYCRAASDVAEVKVTKCANVRGTVFPFFHYNQPDLDKLFPVVVSLYDTALLHTTPEAILAAEPIYMDTAAYYDGTVFIPNTPKFPGYLGRINNPGAPINWEKMWDINLETKNTVLLEEEIPETPIGWYQFDRIEQNDYILVLTKGGYVTRFAIVNINNQKVLLGHKELIPGDLNDDLFVSADDLNILLSNMASYGDEKYNPDYDLNGDLSVDMTDVSLLRFYTNFACIYYVETEVCFSINDFLINFLKKFTHK